MPPSETSELTADAADIAVTNLLPPRPPNVPADLTRPTSRYKRHAWIAGLGLLAFVALYLFLTGWFSWTAYRLIAFGFGPAKAGFWPVVVGIVSGLLGAFLLGALFFVKTSGDPKNHEITAKDEPELFAFLYALADRVGAPRPHRVFLSPRVNAGVFYDLSFVNLLLPTKKNLEIGIGLVNSLTLSEFTAVLAHEYGHFAQRSMAVGRWVYTAQQVAGQIVIARGWLDKLLAGLSNTDLRIAWIGWLMRLIVWSIRSLLDTAFRLVVLAERALGREMEFQADLVSVSATGSDALVHALHRLGAADGAWGLAVEVLARQVNRGKAVPDIFALQSRIVEHTARILNEPDHGASPKIPEERPEEHRVFEEELAEPPRMWSTHPPNRDREINAKRVYVPAKLDSRSAFCLFRDPEGLRRKITADMLSAVTAKLKPISEEDALAAVDERFSSTLFDERYRGVYLGRVVGLAVKTPEQMVGPKVDESELRERLADLYPETLTGEVRDLRVQSNEHAALQALRDGILDAPGGIIRHRGRVIPRNALAGLIDEVNTEVHSKRTRIEAHDRACRAAHLAAARAVGQGWEAYLMGLIKLHHYAAHAEADLDDARGYLANVFAVVTADGQVSSDERRRLIMASVEVHSALQEIYGHRKQVKLPEKVLKRLRKAIGARWKKDKKPKTYDEFFGNDFDLPLADDQNIGQWLQVIDSWIDEPLPLLGTLERVSLEMLVETEEHVRSAYEKGTDPGPAPEPPVVPARYPTLTREEKRERQKKLDLWDRFQIADGFFPTLGRLAVAGGILAVVMGAMPKPEPPVEPPVLAIPERANLTIVNGLDVPVVVEIPGRSIQIQPHKEIRGEILATPAFHIRTRLEIGDEIETLSPRVESSYQYVYNIAGAAVLVQQLETPLENKATATRSLGAPQWYAPSEDATFEEWRTEQQRKASGSGVARVGGSRSTNPARLVAEIEDPAARTKMIAEHVQWDMPSTRWIRGWLELANSLPNCDQLLAQRIERYPRDIATWRFRHHRSSAEVRKGLCSEIHAQSARAPEDLDWRYLALRCDHDADKGGKVFLDEYKKNPYHPYIADAAANELLRQGKYDEAITALEVAASALPLVEDRNLLIARILRLAGRKDTENRIPLLAQESQTLDNFSKLESGEGVQGPNLAFRLLGQGKFAEARTLSKALPRIHRQVMLLAAASEGAPREIVDEFLKLPPSDELSSLIWVEIALLDREARPNAAQIASITRWDAEYAGKVLPFGTLNFLKKGRGPVEAAFAQLSFDKRAPACTMALVRNPERAPAGCRSFVQKFLFASERPFFK